MQDQVARTDAMKILGSICSTELTMDILLRRREFTVGQLFTLSPGSILLFDSDLNEPAILRVNGSDFATGNVAQVKERYALVVTELLEVASSN